MNSSFFRSRTRLGFLLALVLFCIVLTGKSFAQDSDLSANEIIQILQENPDVLAEAKAEIVSQLRDRGYNVSERDITDDRLFNQIRSDDRVRQLAANELAKRGFGPPQEDQLPDEQIVPSGQQPTTQNNQPMGQQGGQQNNQLPFPKRQLNYYNILFLRSQLLFSSFYFQKLKRRFTSKLSCLSDIK